MTVDWTALGQDAALCLLACTAAVAYGLYLMIPPTALTGSHTA